MIATLANDSVHYTVDFLCSRFGAPATIFDGFSFYGGSKGRVYILPASITPSENAVTGGLMISRTRKFVKPSTDFVQVFGHHATLNIVSLDREQAQKYIAGHDIPLTASLPSGVSPGFVILRYGTDNLACGFLRQLTSDTSSESVFVMEYVVENVMGAERRLELVHL